MRIYGRIVMKSILMPLYGGCLHGTMVQWLFISGFRAILCSNPRQRDVFCLTLATC